MLLSRSNQLYMYSFNWSYWISQCGDNEVIDEWIPVANCRNPLNTDYFSRLLLHLNLLFFKAKFEL